MGRRSPVCLAALIGVGLLAGCGGDDSSLNGKSERGGGGQVLTIAAAGKPDTLDPLTTETADGLEVSRQIHEPLVQHLINAKTRATLAGPVLRWQRSKGGAKWLAWLRRGVRFQDGAPLDADAVVVNVRRWLTTEAGRAQISAIEKATAPAKYLVRFSLRQPLKNFPSVLQSPRLALVSPLALSPRTGSKAEVNRLNYTGSGPFVLRKGSLRTTTRLPLNKGWWGLKRGFAPTLAGLSFVWQPDQLKRIGLLRHGRAGIVSDLTSVGQTALRGDFNAEVVRVPDGRRYAVDRWIRGLKFSPFGAEPLVGAWVTQTGQ